MKNLIPTGSILLSCISLLSSCNKHQDTPPNIIFFLIDDQRNDQLSCADHPMIQTPTVDSLAKHGMRFTNAYVTTSISAASRASILTGMYEKNHGYTFGTPPLRKEYVSSSYPALLRKHNYRTAHVGKLGVNLEARDSMLTQIFDYCKLSKRNTPYMETMPDGTQKHSAEIKGEQAIEFIKMQNKDQPFCLSLCFNAVHAVDGNLTPGKNGHYPYSGKMDSMYDSMEIPGPKLSDPDIFEKHPDFLKNSLNRERYFWRWDTPEKYQTNMKAYYRMISTYDMVMKQVLEALKEQGLDENTVIVYSADNGYYMGNRGFAGKWSHFEESLRVPMIIYDPRNVQNEKINDKLVLNIDIPSTILDLAGVKQSSQYQGRSLLPLFNHDTNPDWRKFFYCEHKMDHPKIPKYEAVHGERYVYVNYYEQSPAYEYFHDLKVDPFQLQNFSRDSLYMRPLEEYRKLLSSRK